ncbi:hypothetical protein FHS29_000954 [Saccharothrix tamanrassetensis]|uniref:Uncharacterized protein n=1 Tax=Saccharothrix tamanrassetensis TaxID=1051531 RepID=A0A841CDE6_9PSEU|nr:hypothetical protein [Saccharothrix tamanrassetensis]MBB5954384.1 hypothetical protein [Saccharothrix tamanrassetensis]
MLLAQAAVAHAALVDRKTALDLLGKAEMLLEKVDDDPRSTGRIDRADVGHLAGQALAFLLDHKHAEAALRESLGHRSEGERRSRLLTTHYLAELQLHRGNPELACTTWQHFLDECAWARSGRVHSALHTFRRQLQPDRGNVIVRQALRRAERLAERSTGPRVERAAPQRRLHSSDTPPANSTGSPTRTTPLRTCRAPPDLTAIVDQPEADGLRHSVRPGQPAGRGSKEQQATPSGPCHMSATAESTRHRRRFRSDLGAVVGAFERGGGLQTPVAAKDDLLPRVTRNSHRETGLQRRTRKLSLSHRREDASSEARIDPRQRTARQA